MLSGAGPVDAVSRQALAFRERFSAWGWGGRDVAAFIDPRARSFDPLKALDPAPEDRLLIHYSAYAPRLRGVLDLPGRKLLLSHNVTPARWLWDHDPPIALQCELGRRQLPEYAARCDVVAGVSRFNADELGSNIVIPPIVDLDWIRLKRQPPMSQPSVLFVGRLAPHKRQDEVIRAFALYRRRHAPDARLTLVGEPLNAGYLRALQDLGDRVGGVTIEQTLTRRELAQRYAQASVFLCLSEHEGFCLPLLEAFAADVPVIARPAGAVPETAGDAAVLTEDGPDVIAELLALVTTDDELRAELTRRGHERLEHYRPERSAVALRDALERLA